MALLRSKGGKFSSARRSALGMIVALLAVYGWLYATNAAILSGTPVKEMDWDGDGTVGMREIAQAFYAVEVKKTVEGNRTCIEYAWHTGEGIRVECRTEFKPVP
ncbi:MAG: EF-hand domain-containing protein [Pseudoxanthomonas sp.]